MRTRGWQKVFSFTFIQHIKTKSFIVGTIIVCVLVAALCVLSNILPVLMNSDDDSSSPGTPGGEIPSFSTVYLYDETSLLADADKTDLSEMIGGTVSSSDKGFDELCSELKNAAPSNAAVKISAALDDNGNAVQYNIRTVYSPDSENADGLNAVIFELVNRRIMFNAGVSPEKYESTKIGISTFKIEAGAEEWSILQSAMNYFVPLVVSMVLFLLIFSYGQVVAQSIATEKTSRVMELLLTSVRPLAVVIGKVLAMGLVSFSQFILIGIVGAASFAISAPFGFVGNAMEIASDPKIQESLAQATGMLTSDEQIAQAVNEFTAAFTPINILLIVIIFLLGFVFFSLIAALIGASVSRMEDLQQAMGPYSILGVLGMYLAYFPVIFNIDSIDTGVATTNPVQMFSYFFPVSSPFALPSAILLGTLTPLQSLIGVVVLAAAVVLVAVIVSKVYEAIILHNGNRIKFGDILKMAARK